jgi:hypothetical protein
MQASTTSVLRPLLLMQIINPPETTKKRYFSILEEVPMMIVTRFGLPVFGKEIFIKRPGEINFGTKLRLLTFR